LRCSIGVAGVCEDGHEGCNDGFDFGLVEALAVVGSAVEALEGQGWLPSRPG